MGITDFLHKVKVADPFIDETNEVLNSASQIPPTFRVRLCAVTAAAMVHPKDFAGQRIASQLLIAIAKLPKASEKPSVYRPFFPAQVLAMQLEEQARTDFLKRWGEVELQNDLLLSPLELFAQGEHLIAVPDKSEADKLGIDRLGRRDIRSLIHPLVLQILAAHRLLSYSAYEHLRLEGTAEDWGAVERRGTIERRQIGIIQTELVKMLLVLQREAAIREIPWFDSNNSATTAYRWMPVEREPLKVQ